MGTFKCALRDNVFISKEALEVHMKTLHPVYNPQIQLQLPQETKHQWQYVVIPLPRHPSTTKHYGYAHSPILSQLYPRSLKR